MYKLRLVVFAASVLALLCAAAAPAATKPWEGRGRLQGTIKDDQGKPVEGAKLTLRMGGERVDPAADGPAPVTTDKKGRWSIVGLAIGQWGLKIEKEGFQASEGHVNVGDAVPAPPLNITINAITKEMLEQAQRESAQGEAKGAIERGNALLGERKWPEARVEYQTALAKVEDTEFHPMILRAISTTYFQEGNSDEALATLQKALALKPDDPDSLRLVVDLLVAAGRDAEAQPYIAKLPAGTKMDPNTIINLGIKAFNDGKMDEALEKFDQAVRENPDIPEGYYFRGLVYLNKSKNAEAKADLQKFLEMAPDNRHAAEAKEFLKELK